MEDLYKIYNICICMVGLLDFMGYIYIYSMLDATRIDDFLIS
jgi:hypothetical protein